MSSKQVSKKPDIQLPFFATPTTHVAPKYHQLIRIGHQDLKGLTMLTTMAVTSNTKDQDVVREVVRRWKAHWWVVILAWLFLFQEQKMIIAVVGLTASIDLEAQIGTVPVNVSRVLYDCLLHLATTCPNLLGDRRVLVNSDQILTSGRAFSPDTDALAIVLVWKRTKTPALLLSMLLIIASVLVGVGVGLSSKSVSTGLTFAASVATVFTMLETFLMFLFG